jgi:phospholipid/cholesterol/gamma-HCH transport system substrate-binding protein
VICRRWARVASAIGAAAAGGLLVAGCTPQLEKLPAPAGVSGPVYHIKARFNDVQNLSTGAKVKLQGVVVGEVTTITTKNYVATVSMNIAKKFPLAKVARFQIRFTTPLGEDYISVTSPQRAGQALLANGAVVPVSQTTVAPGIEDTFAALSTLLNGGGLSNIRTIVTELENALKGNTGAARDSIAQLQIVLTNFDAHKDDFNKTLDGLQALSSTINQSTGVVTEALQTLPSTFQLLAIDTSKVAQLLPKIAKLGDRVHILLSQSQSAILADFDELRPTLDSLKSTAGQLVPTMNSLITFGQLFDRAAPGDYLNVDATIEFLLNAPAQRPSLPANPSAATQASANSYAKSSTNSSSISQPLTGGLR